MKRFTVAVAAVALGVAAATQTVRGQDTRSQSTAVSRSSADARTFVEEMAMAGMAEVHLGNLAAERASDEAVKAFGRMMVKDHSVANNELEQVGTQLGVPLPRSSTRSTAASRNV